jgi:hypothetical protein
MNKPIEWLQGGIDVYNMMHNRPPARRGHYVPVDTDLARKIASAFDNNPLWDKGAFTSACYIRLMEELDAQFQFARDWLRVTIEPWRDETVEQPYQNSSEMVEDVRTNHHLYVFMGGEEHPLLGCGYNTEFTFTAVFRAVHDLFGHAAEGFEFGPRGEENAWIHHSMMVSKQAQIALTTETRGANSWVNFFGDHEQLPPRERPYAQQKCMVLPAWCCEWRAALARKKEATC